MGQISSMIEIEVEMDVDVLAAEGAGAAVSLILCQSYSILYIISFKTEIFFDSISDC